MSTNLIEECTRRLVARINNLHGDGYCEEAVEVASVAPIVADVLDILSADGRLHPTTNYTTEDTHA